MATTDTNLGALLFGAYRRQVLALLLMHPEQSFHMRQIARITGQSGVAAIYCVDNVYTAANNPFGSQVNFCRSGYLSLRTNDTPEGTNHGRRYRSS